MRQLRLKQDGFVREISDLQETVEWKDKKIGVRLTSPQCSEFYSLNLSSSASFAWNCLHFHFFLYTFLLTFFLHSATRGCGSTQALERQKEYTDAIRIERDELREETVKLKDILKVLESACVDDYLSCDSWRHQSNSNLSVLCCFFKANISEWYGIWFSKCVILIIVRVQTCPMSTSLTLFYMLFLCMLSNLSFTLLQITFMSDFFPPKKINSAAYTVLP